MSKQVSHQDFLDIDRELEAEQASPPPAGPQEDQQEDRPALYGVNWHEYVARRYAETTPPKIDWLLKGTLPRGIVSVIAGAGGCGKSTATLQGCVDVAAGLPFLGIWPPVRPLRTLFLSVEDNETILHQRIHHKIKQLPPEYQERAKDNICAVPLKGDVALINTTSRGVLEKTKNYRLFTDMIKSMAPDIVVADTYSRFICVEDENTRTTKAISMIEPICDNISVIFLHHVTKTVKYVIRSSDELASALDPHSIRGASSIVNCARLAIMLAPLGRDYASKMIDPDAGFYKDLTYVAIKAAKKNYGPPEDTYYLQRGEIGLFRHVEPLPQENACDSDVSLVEQLVTEIKKRQDEGKEPLAASRAGRILLSLSGRVNDRITQKAVDLGMLKRIPKAKGNGEVLVCV